jgi:hypothetical protein
MRLGDQFTVCSEWGATLPTRFKFVDSCYAFVGAGIIRPRIAATAARWSAPKVL